MGKISSYSSDSIQVNVAQPNTTTSPCTVRSLQYRDFQATEAVQTHLSGQVPGSDFGSLRLKFDNSFVILKQAENRSRTHTAYGENTR